MTLAYEHEEYDEPRADTSAQQAATLLPRISIQAFCETRDVLEALEEARADRRTSRTQMSVQMGGVAAAVDLYREAPTPDVVVLESMAGGQRLLDDLERLADVCDAETQVIIIGHANDVMLYRQLLSRGISEYLIAPIGPVDAIAATMTMTTIGIAVTIHEQLGIRPRFLGLGEEPDAFAMFHRESFVKEIL